METLQWTCIVGAIICAYVSLRFFFGFGIMTALYNVFGGFIDKTSDTVNKISKDSQKKMDRTTEKKRKHTVMYFYRTLVNDILLDIGWKQMGVTMEGLTVLAIAITVIVNLITFLLMQSLAMFIVGIIVFYCLVIAVLFSISRSQHRTRKAILIATEDMLCASMSKGLINAVKTNLNQMDIEVKPDFQKFLDDIDNRMDIVIAIDRLNERLGSKFDNFCEKAKVMSLNYKQGYEDSFLFNVADNAVESRLDAEIDECFSNLNMDYFCTLALLVIFFVVMNSSMGNMTSFYLHTAAGNAILFLYVACAAAVFVYTQIVQSKRF